MHREKERKRMAVVLAPTTDSDAPSRTPPPPLYAVFSVCTNVAVFITDLETVLINPRANAPRSVYSVLCALCTRERSVDAPTLICLGISRRISPSFSSERPPFLPPFRTAFSYSALIRTWSKRILQSDALLHRTVATLAVSRRVEFLFTRSLSRRDRRLIRNTNLPSVRAIVYETF